MEAVIQKGLLVLFKFRYAAWQKKGYFNVYPVHELRR
jgi:hypothetical protein